MNLVVWEYKNDNLNFHTINSSENQCFGRCSVKLTIGSITKKVNLFILNNSNYDFVVGLDLVQNFTLNLTDDLKLYQKIQINDDIILDEIITNYSCSHNNRSKDPNSIGQSTKTNECSVCKMNNSINTIKHDQIDQNKITNRSIQIADDLSCEQKLKLNNLLNKYHFMFSRDRFDIGSINIEQCKVELTNNVPINLRPYKASLIDQKRINDQVKLLLEKNLIRKSVSPYSFPVTLADKKDEGAKTRLCIDLRKLNQITIADNFPFPRLDDIIDKLHDSEYFTTLDISSGFWHIKVHEKDIHKFAFVTQSEHYEWLVMPFGFRNSPAIFQRIIFTILKKHNLTEFTLNYIDDILIHSKSFDEHILHIEKVMQAFRIENVKLKLSKCYFSKKEVNYLGHKLSKNKHTPLNDNVIAIKSFPVPKTVKNVREFLGKINYYHKYISNAAKLLSPLYNLLKKNSKFEWNESCQNAFNQVKDYLCKEPILAIFNPNESSYVFCDSSLLGLGAVLKQKQPDGTLKPIGYFSKKLLDYQKNYEVTELECLCIVQALEYWHHYLYGTYFKVFSDHNALRWIKNFAKPKTRLFNWSMILNQYNFDLYYLAGKANQEADCLSRNPVLERFENSKYIKIVNLLEKSEILKAQKECTEIPKKCKIIKDMIIRKKNNCHKIFVPENLRQKLIEKFHMHFGHIGVKKILALISSSFYFPKMTQLIHQIVSACLICQTNKINRTKKLGLLSQMGPAKNPFEIVSIDTIGGLSGYNSTKQYIHLAVDHFTRFAWTLSSKTQTSKDFINLIKRVTQTGRPKLIIADRYTGIKSKEFLNFLSKSDIKITFIPVNCPQSNGLNERTNQTIMTRLRCIFNDGNQKVSWPKLLDKIIEQYNDTPHETTGFSPNHLLFNKKPYDSIVNDGVNLSLEDVRKIALENSVKNHQVNKVIYDRKHQRFEFKENDKVLVENKNAISRHKLDPIMIGPYKIIKRLSDVSYIVECDKKGKTNDIFHITKLRPYNEAT